MLLLTVEFNLDACTPQYRYAFGLLKTMLTYLLRRQVMSHPSGCGHEKASYLYLSGEYLSLVARFASSLLSTWSSMTLKGMMFLSSMKSNWIFFRGYPSRMYLEQLPLASEHQRSTCIIIIILTTSCMMALIKQSTIL